jgi:hypothetical protein
MKRRKYTYYYQCTDYYQCTECGQISEDINWEKTDIECELCGLHPGLVCPHCKASFHELDVDYPRKTKKLNKPLQ